MVYQTNMFLMYVTKNAILMHHYWRVFIFIYPWKKMSVYKFKIQKILKTKLDIIFSNTLKIQIALALKRFIKIVIPLGMLIWWEYKKRVWSRPRIIFENIIENCRITDSKCVIGLIVPITNSIISIDLIIRWRHDGQTICIYQCKKCLKIILNPENELSSRFGWRQVARYNEIIHRFNAF